MAAEVTVVMLVDGRWDAADEAYVRRALEDVGAYTIIELDVEEV
jgi:glycine cleavage system regulatory protein